ncbi:hypothetical protein ACI8AF_01075 [Blastococcus sp. SYSU D00669]
MAPPAATTPTTDPPADAPVAEQPVAAVEVVVATTTEATAPSSTDTAPEPAELLEATPLSELPAPTTFTAVALLLTCGASPQGDDAVREATPRYVVVAATRVGDPAVATITQTAGAGGTTAPPLSHAPPHPSTPLPAPAPCPTTHAGAASTVGASASARGKHRHSVDAYLPVVGPTAALPSSSWVEPDVLADPVERTTAPGSSPG